MGKNKLHNPTAGEILRDEYLPVLHNKGLTLADIAEDTKTPEYRIKAMLDGDILIDKVFDSKITAMLGISRGTFIRLQDSWLKLITG